MINIIKLFVWITFHFLFPKKFSKKENFNKNRVIVISIFYHLQR